MNKLEELKATYDAAYDAWAAAASAASAAARATDTARAAYEAELKKTQEENSDD
jgi:hypothetical protein